MPKEFWLESDHELSGEALREAIWEKSGQLRRENFRFTYPHRMAEFLKAARTETGNGADTEYVTLVLDQECRSENEHRFDHFEEQWTRLLLVRGGMWKFMAVRNCEDDYNTWVQIYYGDHLSDTAGGIQTGLEAGAGGCLELEDARISEAKLIEKLPEITCAGDIAALTKA